MKKCLLCFFSLAMFVSAYAQYKVALKNIGPAIQPTMWGLFFEDINRSDDGGVYADLIKNRSFDFPDAFMGWTTEPARRLYARNDVFQIIHRGKENDNNAKYLQVTVAHPEKVLLTNEGFGGIAVNKGGKYELIIHSREHQKGLSLKADILNHTNRSIGSIVVSLPSGSHWQTSKAIITTADTTVNGRLQISFEGTGKVDFDRISLFPTDSWQNRSEGLRADLVQKLADIKPGFMRFPGGCIVEGEDIATRYQWKHTIGPVLERKLNSNQWSSGGSSGQVMNDYFQSYGLGFMEYFQLCEGIGAEPMPILNCGLSCQFDAGEVVATSGMDEYVQDALDLIEFANGDAVTAWGRKRTDLGHPKPFNLKMLGIGNENWGPKYVERLELFTKAIKTKYPDIRLITSTGYSPNPQFRYMDSALRKMKVDIIDEHYYQTPNWFLMNAGKYDRYDRKGPKIFLGEYACHSVRIGNTENKNTQLCTLAEAAFMTGLERNADMVIMAAYAPLFAHVKDWQWTPNLIWFDNQRSFATPSYYVQQLFSLNKGTDVVSITENGNRIAGTDSVWASAVVDRNSKEVIVKLVNPSGTSKQKNIMLEGLKKKNTTGTVIMLQGDAQAVNGLEKELIQSVSRPVTMQKGTLSMALPAYSFQVVRMKME